MIKFGAHCMVKSGLDPLLQANNKVLQQIKLTKEAVIADNSRPDDVVTIMLYQNPRMSEEKFAQVHFNFRSPISPVPENNFAYFNLKNGKLLEEQLDDTEKPKEFNNIQEWVKEKWDNAITKAKIKRNNIKNPEELKRFSHQASIDAFKEDKEAAKVDKGKLDKALDILS